MPTFVVMIHGRGIALKYADTPNLAGIYCPDDDAPRADIDGAEPVSTGFFTGRRVTARDASLAAQIACARVLEEWKPGGDYAAGGMPTLMVDDIWICPWWRRLLRRDRSGYTFYARD